MCGARWQPGLTAVAPHLHTWLLRNGWGRSKWEWPRAGSCRPPGPRGPFLSDATDGEQSTGSISGPKLLALSQAEALTGCGALAVVPQPPLCKLGLISQGGMQPGHRPGLWEAQEPSRAVTVPV